MVESLAGLVLPNGFTRWTAVRDVHAPAELIFSRILDMPEYPRMVNGFVACDIYRRELSPPGTQRLYAKYKVRELGVTLECFMQHEYDWRPAARGKCLSWSLDYSRSSDISDTVGYWFVEPLADGWSRCYYSCDMSLPTWIPAVLRDTLLSVAAKRATSWLGPECQLAMRKRAMPWASPRLKLNSLLQSRWRHREQA